MYRNQIWIFYEINRSFDYRYKILGHEYRTREMDIIDTCPLIKGARNNLVHMAHFLVEVVVHNTLSIELHNFSKSNRD